MISCENCNKKYEKNSDKWHIVDVVAICKECQTELKKEYENDDFGQSEYDSAVEESETNVS